MGATRNISPEEWQMLLSESRALQARLWQVAGRPDEYAEVSQRLREINARIHILGNLPADGRQSVVFPA